MNTRRILAAALVAIVAAGGGVLANHWLNGGEEAVAETVAHDDARRLR